MDFDQAPVRRVRVRDGAALPGPDQWPLTVPAVAQVVREGFTPARGVTLLVGENGSGKSTVVEALAEAYGLSPEGGTPYGRHSTRASESPLGRRCRSSAGWRPAATGSSCGPRRCTAGTPSPRTTRGRRTTR